MDSINIIFSVLMGGSRGRVYDVFSTFSTTAYFLVSVFFYHHLLKIIPSKKLLNVNGCNSNYTHVHCGNNASTAILRSVFTSHYVQNAFWIPVLSSGQVISNHNCNTVFFACFSWGKRHSMETIIQQETPRVCYLLFITCQTLQINTCAIYWVWISSLYSVCVM